MDNQPIKILYVEDEPFLAKIVKESLETRGFMVEMVADGALAVERFTAFEPDIAVLDVMLPNMSGYEIGTILRRLSPSIPIIFLTAKTQTDDVLKGFESGGNDYIRKPFSMEELIVRIKNLLSFSKKDPSVFPTFEGISIGNFTFFPQKYALEFGESSRRLSHRETELLKILCENRHFTVDRKDVLMRIWGDDSFFNSRNLDVYITKLRDYLKADPTVEIMTVKGVGYHFSAS